jgi:hypothetical protein
VDIGQVGIGHWLIFPTRRLSPHVQPKPLMRSQRSDRSNQPNSGYNGIFVLFGQYFDHGLDFIEKGGNIGADGQRARIVIPLGDLATTFSSWV